MNFIRRLDWHDRNKWLAVFGKRMADTEYCSLERGNHFIHHHIYYFIMLFKRVTVFCANIKSFGGLSQVKGILVKASVHFFLYTFGIYFYCEKLELLEKVEWIFCGSKSDFELKRAVRIYGCWLRINVENYLFFVFRLYIFFLNCPKYLNLLNKII